MRVLLWSHASSGRPSVRPRWSPGCCAPSWAAWFPSCSRTWCTTSMTKRFRMLRQQKTLTMEMRRIRRSSPLFAGGCANNVIHWSMVPIWKVSAVWMGPCFSSLMGPLLQLSGGALASVLQRGFCFSCLERPLLHLYGGVLASVVWVGLLRLSQVILASVVWMGSYFRTGLCNTCLQAVCLASLRSSAPEQVSLLYVC